MGARGTRSFSQGERRTSCGRRRSSADTCTGSVLIRQMTRVLMSSSHHQGEPPAAWTIQPRSVTATHRAHAGTIAPPSATEHGSVGTHSWPAPLPGPTGHEGPVGAQFHKNRVSRGARIADGASSGPPSSTGLDVTRARATSSLMTCSAARAAAPRIRVGHICAMCPECTTESSTPGLGVTREAFHVKRASGYTTSSR